jgi:hypothetical protein
MANRPEVLSTKNTSPETPMQFGACRNVLLCVDLLAGREDFQAAALKRTAMLVCWIVRIA